MNLKELRERLDDFGDEEALVVVVTDRGGESEKEWTDLEVDSGQVTDADGDRVTGYVIEAYRS